MSPGDFEASLAKYQEAARVALADSDSEVEDEMEQGAAVCFGNSSLVQLKLNRPEDALKSAKQSCKLDPSYDKARHRLAKAHEALGNADEATKAFEQAEKLTALAKKKAARSNPKPAARPVARQQSSSSGSSSRDNDNDFGPDEDFKKQMDQLMQVAMTSREAPKARFVLMRVRVPVGLCLYPAFAAGGHQRVRRRRGGGHGHAQR
jgi:tetratricopeptide (TPR) repeat protein